MLLRQVGPGEVEGIYAQQISDTQGYTQYSLCRRTYRYEGTRTLQSDQMMVYRLLNLDERLDEPGGTHVIEFRSQAYNVPVEYRRLLT